MTTGPDRRRATADAAWAETRPGSDPSLLRSGAGWSESDRTMPGPVTQVPGIVPGSLGRALWKTLLGGGLLLLVMGLFGSRLWWPGQRPATVPAMVEPAVAPPRIPAAVAVPAVPKAVDAKAVEPSIRRAGAADRAEVKHSLPVNRRVPSRRSSPAHKAQPFDSDPLSEEQAPNPFVVTPDLGRSR